MKINAVCFVISLFIFYKNGSAQTPESICDGFISDEPSLLMTSCSSSSDSWINKYQYQDYWIPDLNNLHYTPIKTIRVNVHFMQKETPLPAGNFDIDNETEMEWIENLFENVNNYFSNICSPSDPLECVCASSCNITDTRIRFQIVNFYEHQSNVNYLASGSTLFNTYAINTDTELNIFFKGTDDGTINGATNILPSFNLSLSTYITMDDVYYGFLNNPYALYSGSSNLAHEFGHAFGLLHTYEPTCCPETCDIANIDYLDDVFGSAVIGCPNICWLDYGWGCDVNSSLNTCTNNMMGGTAESCYFSPEQIGRMQRSLHLYHTRKYVIDCPSTTQEFIVSSNEIWDFNMRLYHAIIRVSPGTSLTIKCKLILPTDARIIIEKGAKLIVDGGTITKSCDGLWQGIEVWGNSSYTAHPTKNDIVTGAYPSSAAHHGVVWIKNGGTIAYARNAITTSKYDDYANQNYYGGIVLAENSTFRNNKRSAEFMKYDYYPYDADDDNISEFKNCTFIIDDDYPASETCAYHLSMWDVDGVAFTDNVYLDNRTTLSGSTQAIYSIDATYKVNSILCSPPPPNTCIGDYNYFEGFMRGIHAANANYRPLNIEINTGVFEDNTRGILLSNVKNSLIINNTFRIQDNIVNSYGLYLEDCENYQVENNYFSSLAGFDGVAPFNAGVYAANNSNAHTLVYRNIFEGLETGIRCQVNNKNLQIKCNTFLSEINRYHVYATSGLLGHQGKCLPVGNPPADRVRAPAGNIFSHDCIYTEGDFKIHTGITELKYRHHTGLAYTPQCYTTPNIVPLDCGLTANEGGYVACPSTLPGSGEALVAGGGSSASALLAEYNATEELISGLEEMIAAAEIATEENDDLTYFTAIQEQLSNKIVSGYITELKSDSAIWFLEQQATDKAKETIVQIYLMTEEFTAAETALKNVNTATIEGADFVTLYEVLIPVASEGRTILQLGKKEISIIESLAGKQSPSGVAAENILQFIHKTDYSEVFDAELPEDLRLMQQENVVSSIQMFPNPANKTLTIAILEFDSEKEYVFKAWAMNGSLIADIKLIAGQDNIIPISTWSMGMYLCEVLADGEVLFTDKLIKE